jgi:hypothetical protein
MSAQNPVIQKQYPNVTIIEDDEGFSVVYAITYTNFGAMSLEYIGRALGKEFGINAETKHTGIEYPAAEALAEKIEAFYVKQSTKKKK